MGGEGRRVGFVFVRQERAPRSEAFFNQIIAGLDEVLAGAGRDLVVRVVEQPADEVEVYRQWKSSGLVEAVIIKDLLEEDPRFALLDGLGLSFAALTDITHEGRFPGVRIDNGQAVRDSLAFLVERGHRRLARVTGPEALVHTRRRTAVFTEELVRSGASGVVVAGDYSSGSGLALTQALLTTDDRPTAIIYDNDLMALGGLQAAQEVGLPVPDQLSLLAWDDSVACQLSTPALSALSHDVHEMGVQLGQVALGVLVGPDSRSSTAPGLVVVERETTGPAPPETARATGPRPPLHLEEDA